MIALIQITPWHWAGFILCVLIFLALDLGVFHRGSRIVKFKEALAWSALWFALAMAFAGAMIYLAQSRGGRRNSPPAMSSKLSLSLDNILVIALIFAWFRVPAEFQHRLLFWGILGALVMRGAMIAVGVALIHQFDWVLYLFGAFLVFAGAKCFSRNRKRCSRKKIPCCGLREDCFQSRKISMAGNFSRNSAANLCSRRSRSCCCSWKPPI